MKKSSQASYPRTFPVYANIPNIWYSIFSNTPNFQILTKYNELVMII